MSSGALLSNKDIFVLNGVSNYLCTSLDCIYGEKELPDFLKPLHM